MGHLVPMRPPGTVEKAFGWHLHIFPSSSLFVQCLFLQSLLRTELYNIDPGDTETVTGLAYVGSTLIFMETAAEKPGEG